MLKEWFMHLYWIFRFLILKVKTPISHTVRRRCNFELERDFSEPNILAIVKWNRLKWAGHLARMSPNQAPTKLSEKDHEGNRGVGRPKTRWIDGVQSDLSALNIRNWKRTAQDRPTLR